MKSSASLIGLLNYTSDEWAKGDKILASGEEGELDDAAINEKIAARNAARSVQDYVTADAIRDALATAGIILEDNQDGTIWRRG